MSGLVDKKKQRKGNVFRKEDYYYKKILMKLCNINVYKYPMLKYKTMYIYNVLLVLLV